MRIELGSEPLPAPILAFIDAEFAEARTVFAGRARPREKRDRAQDFFTRAIRQFNA